MIQRTIETPDNQPLLLPNGTPAANTKVTALLLVENAIGNVFDAISGETIFSEEVVTSTSSTGKLSLTIWPTSRGNKSSVYVVTVHTPIPQRFTAPLAEGDLSVLPWLNFVLNGQPLTPMELSALQQHIEDMHAHMPDAPEDGTGYVRKNRAWVQFSGTGTAATTVVEETAPGLPAQVGVSLAYAREDHSHGTPVDNIVESVAASVVNGGRVLRWSGDSFEHADSSNLAHLGSVVGVSTGAAVMGAPATAKIAGTLEDSAFNFTPNFPLFFSSTGVLTHTPPSAGFIQVVGTAVTATKIFINLGSPIQL